MRFTRKNWDKFFDGSGKITTIRLKKNRVGLHNAWCGPYNMPVKLGCFDIVKVVITPYSGLTDHDAHLDGFKDLVSLRMELEHLNGNISPSTLVYIHFCANVKKEEVDPYE